MVASSTRHKSRSDPVPKLLIVTGDPCIHDAMEHAIVSPRIGVEVLTAWDAGDGWRRTLCDGPDVVVIDLDLPGGSWTNLFELVRTTDPKLVIVLVATEGTADTAVEAMTRGAFDYVLKPLACGQLNRRMDAALQAARRMRTPVLLPHAPAGVLDGAYSALVPTAGTSSCRIAGKNWCARACSNCEESVKTPTRIPLLGERCIPLRSLSALCCGRLSRPSS
jgi:DNA-binding response OmpR family regulator